jgi:hypothetical protein
MNITIVALIVFFFNIPFGYWRENVRKYSLSWALSIHVPIPFIILLRIYSGIGFQFITYPIMICAFFMGQLAGAWFYKQRMRTGNLPLTGCLVMDLYRSFDQ